MNETPTVRKPKYRRISEELASAIRRGKYAPGDRLPTERELAKQYEVHRMTIRQATTALARTGLVVKRRPAGIFVREERDQDLRVRPMNLICPAKEFAHVIEFIEYGEVLARKQNYRPRVLRIYPGEEHIATEAVLSSDPSILFGVGLGVDDELRQAMRKAANRVVVIGARLDHDGLRSIVADDEMGIRLAVNHLREKGHERIALVCSVPEPGHPMMEIHIQFWRQAMLSMQRYSRHLDRDIIRLDPVPIGGATVAANEAVHRYFQRSSKTQATALIGLSEEACTGAVAACYDLKLRVPEDVSIVDYSGTYRAAMDIPPRTTIDVRIEKHLELAMRILRHEDLGSEVSVSHGGKLFVLQPKLEQRQSVADITAADTSD